MSDGGPNLQQFEKNSTHFPHARVGRFLHNLPPPRKVDICCWESSRRLLDMFNSSDLRPRRRIDTPIEDCESGRQSATSGLKKIWKSRGDFFGCVPQQFWNNMEMCAKKFRIEDRSPESLKEGTIVRNNWYHNRFYVKRWRRYEFLKIAHFRCKSASFVSLRIDRVRQPFWNSPMTTGNNIAQETMVNVGI